MKVEVVYRNDHERPLTDPILESGGRKFVFRLYAGDLCDPMNGKWFEPPWPTVVIRFKSWLPLPFVAWKWPFIDRVGYAGFKLWGVDSPEYKNWIDSSEVYEGSQALCTSIRPFASIKKQ